MGGPSQRVDKVDTLLDGDAGSRRLVILALLPLSPPVPPLLLKNSGNTRVSAIFQEQGWHWRGQRELGEYNEPPRSGIPGELSN